MIDPKFNEMPVAPDDEIVEASEAAPSASTASTGKRRGLSINDTVAANANLSVGGRGVDTSGVRAGAGAGAGMTSLTAGEAGESPSPQILGGARGSGTTVLGSNDSSTTGSTVPSGLDAGGDLAGLTTGASTGSSTVAALSDIPTHDIRSESVVNYGTSSGLPTTSFTGDLAGHEAQISARAYELWCERGCPVGSPELDWDNAVAEFRRSGLNLTRSASI